MKLEFDLDLEVKDLTSALESSIKAATAAVSQQAFNKGKELASSKLRQGLTKWNKAYSFKVSQDFYVIALEGKVANWIEDGARTGEISEAIMSGNRANFNKSLDPPKEYVDVPMFRSVAGGAIQGTPVRVEMFRDAAALSRAITFSDWKKRSVKTRERTIRRVKYPEEESRKMDSIIRSTAPSGKTSYLSIRRVTEDSVWPSTPTKGARVFRDLEDYIDQNFGKILERII